MNEKIKQLAQQSELWDSLSPRSLGISDSSTENVWGEELQEFAELIVRECAGIVDNKIEVSRYVHEAELLRECSTTIKLHFGVEG
jgi:hypothetical protein